MVTPLMSPAGARLSAMQHQQLLSRTHCTFLSLVPTGGYVKAKKKKKKKRLQTKTFLLRNLDTAKHERHVRKNNNRQAEA
jgi:hypothetical protein